MTRPTLGLALSPPWDPLLTRFLAMIARWSSVRQASAGDPVDGWIVTDDIDPSRISSGLPVLVWTRSSGGAVEARWPEAIVVGPLCNGTERGVLVPDPNIDATAIPYVAPLVRGRWRQRYGLPTDLVLRIDDDAGSDVAMSLRPTALAVAAVIVATGDAVLNALAWGAPTVTDEVTARRLRLGGVVEAVAPPDLLATAHQLSHSVRRMAELAWSGRVLVEETFDIARVAHSALEMAELLRPRAAGSREVVARLNELWATPQRSWSMIQAISS